MTTPYRAPLLAGRSGGRLLHLTGALGGLAGLAHTATPGALAGAGLAAGLLAWALCALLARQLGRQQRVLQDTLDRWQAGDHLARVQPDGLREFTEIADRLNDDVRDRHRRIDTTAQTGHEVAHAASELQGRAGRVAAIAHEQRGASVATASAVEQMSASIAEIARQGADARQRADTALEAANQGADLVNATSRGLDTLAGSGDRIAATLEQLARHSQDIGQITAIIKSVSDQTNLLALNASIEASRAGEFGRGFAVVADEVRTLSRGVAESAADISNTLREVSQAIAASVDQTQVLREQARTSVADAQGANAALGRIRDEIRLTLASVDQIAVATEQQGVASREIAGHITRIADHAHTQSTMADDTAGVAAHLTELAERAQTTLSVPRP